MIRFCPNCLTERPLDEFFCGGTVDGTPCEHDLSVEPVRPRGSRPKAIVTSVAPDPESGSARPDGDTPWQEPGQDAAPDPDDTQKPDKISAAEILGQAAAGSEPTVIGGWILLGRLPALGKSAERYSARHAESGLEATMTLFYSGFEPEPLVYETLQRLPLEHVPQIYASGRWENRFYTVAESFSGRNLADLGHVIRDENGVRHIINELGQALNALGEAGVRHRDLNPGLLAVRGEDPLDLVITGFGSARLSDFDLDVVAPLEANPYMAPEALAGAVSPASDWWSLGMILLEQLSGGELCRDSSPQEFLVGMLTSGVTLPEGLDADIALLLKGLLTRDHRHRWQWNEVRSWLEGGEIAAKTETVRSEAGNPALTDGPGQHAAGRPAIELSGQSYTELSAFVLNASHSGNWAEAAELFASGAIAGWVESMPGAQALSSPLRRIMEYADQTRQNAAAAPNAQPDDWGLMLTLKLLHGPMPLVLRGELLTPGWLLNNPKEAYALVHSWVPRLITAMFPDEENWLHRLGSRESSVRERAKSLEIPLNEEALRIYSLNTSQSRLHAVWTERLKSMPESEHPGLACLMERPGLTDADCITLLSAEPGLFSTADQILARAGELASSNSVEGYSATTAAELVSAPRRHLNRLLNQRLANFTYTGHVTLDAWAQDYRLDKSLPLACALVLLSIPENAWKTPHKQLYLADLLTHFDKKISASAMRGPLARMQTGRRGINIDLFDLGTERAACDVILDRVLQRSARRFTFDPDIFNSGTDDKNLRSRMSRLQRTNQLYLRDTGIDGMYLGFPFLLFRPGPSMKLPRVMPVLLWPMRIYGSTLTRDVSFGFDVEREEVRLNPLLGPLLGPDRLRAWQEAASELLAMENVDFRTAMEVLCAAADTAEHDLQPLNPLEREIQTGVQHLISAAVLFHASFMGQAISEELRQLANFPAIPGAMGTLLDIHEPPQVKNQDEEAGLAKTFLVTRSDPSQELAVQKSEHPRGLLIEGPPGTGKSQTIVNMVAQAIGGKRSVLIVCQKKAALDVVRKRLAAEGLDSRIIMVTDIQKDRLPVIKAVRTQVETIFGKGLSMPARLRRERAECAARIERLEGDLDAAHQALHQVGECTGHSYRSILSDLIALDAGADAGSNRPFRFSRPIKELLCTLSYGEVQKIADSCTPLLKLWLPAGYENSPLNALKAFNPEAEALRAMHGAFEDFCASESERRDYFKATSTTIPLESTLAVSNWVTGYADQFKSLITADLRLAAKWLPLFKLAGMNKKSKRGEALMAELEAVVEKLDALPVQDYAEALSGPLAAMGADALPGLAKAARFEASSPSLWRRILPGALLARMRLSAFAKKCGQGKLDQRHLAALPGAVALELAARPQREKLRAVQARLGLPQTAADEVLGLYQEASGVLRKLRLFGSLLSSLVDLPGAENLEYAMTIGSTGELQRFLLEYEVASERGKRIRRGLLLLNELEPWFEDSWLARCREKMQQAANVDDMTAPVADLLDHVPAYMAFRLRAGDLNPVCLEFLRLLRAHESELNAISAWKLEESFHSLLHYETLTAWKERIEREHPMLQMEMNEAELKVGSLSQERQKMLALNREYLSLDIDASKLGTRAAWEDITRLTGNRARRLREFMAQGREAGLLELRPVWLMNPDIASRVLPLVGNLFDMVIYDEASQMPVEYAVPTLYRARSAVVSGDEKQMPPSSFFSIKLDSGGDGFAVEHDEEVIAELAEDREPGGDGRAEIKDCTDMLQLARRSLPQTTLQIHYRSKYGELIGFSNAAFYNGQLHVPVRHSEKEILAARPLRFVEVGGLYGQQSNVDEARAVLALLEEIWNRPGEACPTVGVVTFNQKQAGLIEQMLEDRAMEDENFRRLLIRESSRDEAGEDMSFFVKNVENVQGDERDVIIFSSTYGRDADGRFIRNFGALGHRGGERRLNVAITRARKQVVLVNSMPVQDISDMLSTQRLPMMPRDYLQVYWAYARAVSEGEFGAARRILARVMPKDAWEDERDDAPLLFDGFRKAVNDCLEKAGWKPVPAERHGVFGLDFLLENSASGRFFIGIECDSPSHPLLAKAGAREVWRRSLLERSVPRICRLSSQAWLKNPALEAQRLRDTVDAAFRESGEAR